MSPLRHQAQNQHQRASVVARPRGHMAKPQRPLSAHALLSTFYSRTSRNHGQTGKRAATFRAAMQTFSTRTGTQESSHRRGDVPIARFRGCPHPRWTRRSMFGVQMRTSSQYVVPARTSPAPSPDRPRVRPPRFALVLMCACDHCRERHSTPCRPRPSHAPQPVPRPLTMGTSSEPGGGDTATTTSRTIAQR